MSAKTTWIAFAFTLSAVLVGWWFLREPFPKSTSAESLHLMKALYTACSSQNESRLTKVETAIADAHTARQLSDAERTAFDEIIADAKRGEWRRARDDSYRFAQAQLR